MKSLISAEAEARARQQDLQDEDREKELAKKNPAFLQITKAYLPLQRQLTRREPAAGFLLSILCERMNRQNAVACSQKTLAKISNYSLPTVKRAIAVLEKEHWIQIIKIGKSNAYIINSKVFWQNTREGRFAVFNATIVADEEEQSMTAEQWEGIELKHIPHLLPGEQAVLIGEDNEQKELDL